MTDLPTKENLRSRLAVLLAHLDQFGVVQERGLAGRGPGAVGGPQRAVKGGGPTGLG